MHICTYVVMYIRFMHTYVHIDLWMYTLCMEVSTYVHIYVRMYIWPILSPPFHSWHWQLAKIDNRLIQNNTIQPKGYDTIKTIQYDTIDMITMNDTYTNDDIDKVCLYFIICVYGIVWWFLKCSFPLIPGCRRRKQMKVNVIVFTRAGHLIM